MEKEACSYELTLSQQFELIKWGESAKTLTREELELAFIELARTLFTQKNAVMCIMKDQLGAL